MKNKILCIVFIATIFLFGVSFIVADEVIYCEDYPSSSDCICRDGIKTAIPCIPSGNIGCTAIVSYGCVDEFDLNECVTEWESKNILPDNYDLEFGEISYNSGKLLVVYNKEIENPKVNAADLLDSYGLAYEDLGGTDFGFTVTVPVGSEFEWLCTLQQDDEFSVVELDTIFIGKAGETGSCAAYWEGYVYDSVSNECKLEGTSGCNDPFEFKTEEECNEANIIQDETNNLLYWMIGIVVIVVIILFLILRKRK